MEKRKFGIHDEMLSIVGLGGISIKNTGQNKSDRLVRYAFDNGEKLGISLGLPNWLAWCAP